MSKITMQKDGTLLVPDVPVVHYTVSYTHLTLPTNA